MVQLLSCVLLYNGFFTSQSIANCSMCDPTTPHLATISILTPDRFRLFRVRSSLLTESLTISVPLGTEIFHFPRFLISFSYRE